MLIPEWAWQSLVDAGVQPGAADNDAVDLWITGHSGQRVRVEAKVYSSPRPIGPSDVRRLVRHLAPHAGHVFVIAPSLSNEVRAALDAEGWSYLTGSGNRDATGVLRLPSGEFLRFEPDEAEGTKSKPGRIPFGRFSLIRRLLSDPRGRTQTELASLTGVSQPRVSQVMSELAADGLVSKRSRAQWVAADWDALLARFMQTYPGAGGVTTYWYGLNPLRAQVLAASDLLESTTSVKAPQIGVSADPAAEYIAAWRQPQRAVIYCQQGADLHKAGLVPASPSEATLLLTVPKDISVWAQVGDDTNQLAPGAPFKIANPIQVMWDVANGPALDSDQAVAQLQRQILDHYTARASHER